MSQIINLSRCHSSAAAIEFFRKLAGHKVFGQVTKTETRGMFTPRPDGVYSEMCYVPRTSCYEHCK